MDNASATQNDRVIKAPELDGLSSINHGFFTRNGGVSEGIYESLNAGFGSNDDSANVTVNRQRIADKLGIAPENLITPYQKHTGTAVIANEPWKREDAPVADAVVTNTPGIAVAILTADCAPVLFADPIAKVVAAAHSGWRGAIGGILGATVEKMLSLGATKDNIIAVTGPSLSQAAYEVGPEFKDEFLKEAATNERFFDENRGPKPHFDLPAYVDQKLKELGVTSSSSLQLCTYTRESLFYSYRRSVHNKEGDYGRQISAILLK